MQTAPMTDHAITPVRFERVLFPTDFSPCSDRALTHLLCIATTYRSHVLILHVVPSKSAPTAETVSDFAPHLFDFNRHEAEGHMRALENSGTLGRADHCNLIETGDLSDVVENTVRRRHVDLVVIGTSGRGGIKKLLLGSVAEAVSRRLPCAVMIVGPKVPAVAPGYKFRRVLFATEFATGSANPLHYALSMAQQYGASLILLHVCTFMERGPLVDSNAALVLERERLQAMIPEDFRVSPSPEVITRLGTKTEAILATATEFAADLIVIGVHSTHALAAVTHFPWTVAHQVICRATCPVLTVRG